MSVLENLFTDIADAIRDKTGETDAIRPIDFPEKIAGIKENSIELLENVLIQPDFSNGNQSFSAPDEMAVKSAIIQKPETLIPENIAEGVNIAGIVGSLVSGGALKVSKVTLKGTAVVSGVNTLKHDLGVLPDIIYYNLGACGSNTISFAIGFSQAFQTATKIPSGVTKYGSGNATAYGYNIDREADSAGFHHCTAEEIRIGNSSIMLDSGFNHVFYLVGGLT